MFFQQFFLELIHFDVVLSCFLLYILNKVKDLVCVKQIDLQLYDIVDCIFLYNQLLGNVLVSISHFCITCRLVIILTKVFVLLVVRQVCLKTFQQHSVRVWHFRHALVAEVDFTFDLLGSFGILFVPCKEAEHVTVLDLIQRLICLQTLVILFIVPFTKF